MRASGSGYPSLACAGEAIFLGLSRFSAIALAFLDVTDSILDPLVTYLFNEC